MIATSRNCWDFVLMFEILQILWISWCIIILIGTSELRWLWYSPHIYFLIFIWLPWVLVLALRSLIFITACGGASLVTQMVRNLLANAGDLGSVPGARRSPGEENGNLLQYSCLENPIDRGWATVHGVTNSPACQAPLSMGFPRQEYWSRLPFSSLGHLPNPGFKPKSPVFPALAGRFFTT